ncbi:MAG: hypothetical protein C3F14_02895, partial [Deltaproteobacteria bacterium]
SIYLVESFHATAIGLGIFSSMYFYPYAVCQPFVGVLTDRLGGRRIIACFTFIAFLGCLLFSVSREMVSASLGRVLVGIGVAGAFVPSIEILAPLFQANQFGLINGLLMTIGTAGAIGASVPLAASALHFGWRQTFLIIALATLTLSLLAFSVIREGRKSVSKGGTSNGGEGRSSLKDSIRLILRDRYFWLKGFLLFFIFGTYITFQGLWSYPLLVGVYRIDGIFASKILMTIGIGFISSSVLTGFLSDRIFKSRKLPIVSLTGMFAMTWWVLVIYLETLNRNALVAVFFFMGFAAGGLNPILFTMVKELLTEKGVGVGLGIGLINPSAFVGVAFYQTVTGYVIGHGSAVQRLSSTAGYRNAFLLCAVTSLFAFFLTFFLKETYPRTQ